MAVMMREKEGMVEIRCPYCGAEYKVPRGSVYATCPYCGTTVKIGEQRVEEKHYVFRLMIDKNRAYKDIVEYAEQQWNSVRGLVEKALVEKAILHYLPLYIIRINIRVEAEEGREYKKYVSALAMKQPPFPLPPDYGFPVRGKDTFKPSIIKNTRYYMPDIPPSLIVSRLKAEYLEEAKELAEALGGANIVDESSMEGVAHYPFWEIHYKYEDRIYRGVIDGADGTIVYLEYPLSTTGRIMTLSAGTTILLGCVGLGAGIGILAAHPLLGAVAGLISGIAGAVRLLTASFSIVGRYRYNPAEEGYLAPIR